MSSIDKVPAGWRARWRTPEGQSRSKTFVRKGDAQRHLAMVDSEMVTGAYIDASRGRLTFGEYAERWRATQVHRPSTTVLVEANLRRHVLPYLGKRQLGSIKRSDIQGWVRGRSEVLSPATVELVYRYVVAILRSAVADRIIPANPAVGIRLPHRSKPKVEPLETEVVESLINGVPRRYQALVVVAAGTGMRQGECLGLTSDRVQFLRRTLNVDRQLVLLPGSEPMFAPPKTEASYRTIPLPDVVVEALAAHLQEYGTGPGGLLFTNEKGLPIRRNRLADIWRVTVKNVGAPPGTGFHALRHYYASLLIRHGESVKVVQARLGHASAAETLDTYSHLWPDSEDRTRAAVEVVLGAALRNEPSGVAGPAESAG